PTTVTTRDGELFGQPLHESFHLGDHHVQSGRVARQVGEDRQRRTRTGPHHQQAIRVQVDRDGPDRVVDTEHRVDLPAGGEQSPRGDSQAIRLFSAQGAVRRTDQTVGGRQQRVTYTRHLTQLVHEPGQIGQHQESSRFSAGSLSAGYVVPLGAATSGDDLVPVRAASATTPDGTYAAVCDRGTTVLDRTRATSPTRMDDGR